MSDMNHIVFVLFVLSMAMMFTPRSDWSSKTKEQV